MFVSTKSQAHPRGQDIYVHIPALWGIRLLCLSYRIMVEMGLGNQSSCSTQFFLLAWWWLTSSQCRRGRRVEYCPLLSKEPVVHIRYIERDNDWFRKTGCDQFSSRVWQTLATLCRMSGHRTSVDVQSGELSGRFWNNFKGKWALLLLFLLSWLTFLAEYTWDMVG